ncbi:MAG: 4-hydroxy-tetrahydrodipicolinate synthase [Cyclobacteriaceae bacterium]|jgi:4-hydroxy-tetrahydrodipicolinate synthase|nr:4-hydroxy-tetrahydrodipicolinate synthase [Cyclobacteriaceae bacterium]
MKSLRGTGVALVTPFLEDGEIDFGSLKKLINHTAKGVDYYVVMGTTGESATCSADEKREVLEFVIKNNRKGLPIVYGIGGNHTHAVLEEIDATRLKGVDALLSVSPYYNKPSQEGIAQHFEAVAEFSPVPILLYNVPGRTASNLTAATTLRLAKHKNIIGIKESSGNLEQCMTLARSKPNDFLLISGDDLLALPLYAIGGAGVISVLANAYPVLFKRLTTAAAKADYRKAQTETFKLLDINGPMYEEGNPTGVKFLLSLMGLCQPYTRLPLVPPSPALQTKIKALHQRLS